MVMIDIKNCYFGTPLPTYEYKRLPLAIIPYEIIKNMTLKQRQWTAGCTWKYVN